MKLERTYIDAEFDRFFEFPTDDRSQVSSVSCKLFALAIAQPLLEEIARLQSVPAEQGAVPEPELLPGGECHNCGDDTCVCAD